MDNFRGEKEVTDLYNLLTNELTTFFNNPFRSMNVNNSKDTLREALKQVMKLNK